MAACRTSVPILPTPWGSDVGDKSGISWTNATWNPVLGCTKVSAGCRNCYAMRTAYRMVHNTNMKISTAYAGLVRKSAEGPTWTGKVNAIRGRLDQPIRWRKPKLIFVNSMSDLFHEGVPFPFIAAVFGVMAAAPRHTFQVLTKRPDRARDFFAWLKARAERSVNLFPHDSLEWRTLQQCQGAALSTGVHVQAMGKRWPLPNVWLGVSIENIDSAHRLNVLRDRPSAVRFLSCEPLLGPLDGLDLEGVDWLIVGDESGPRRRGALLDWARGLRDACLAAGVPFFLKQWHTSAGVKQELPHLDGRQWEEMPKATAP